ncbi:MAG: protoglobin domain-containing protein [Candidatus Heimdallarchaeota archaeon]|nr:protoglobin domain-containing protein [Candidatus Heimdallarchaeota archaeon]
MSRKLNISQSDKLTQGKLQQLLALANVGDKEHKILRNLHKTMKKDDLKKMIELFYDELLKFDYPQSFFENEQLLARTKARQIEYFEDFLSADKNLDFFENRRNLGAIHERIGLDNLWYLASYTVLFTKLVELIEASTSDVKDFASKVTAVGKLMLMDIGAVVTSYIDARENIIKAQSEEVLELSSPVLRLTNEITIIPLLGTLDSVRALQIMEKILNTIEKTNAKVVIIDITGVPLIDTSTGANLVRTVNAINLMGSEVIITGLSPRLAQTIVELGIDLKQLKTKSNLADGLSTALKYVAQMT